MDLLSEDETEEGDGLFSTLEDPTNGTVTLPTTVTSVETQTPFTITATIKAGNRDVYGFILDISQYTGTKFDFNEDRFAAENSRDANGIVDIKLYGAVNNVNTSTENVKVYAQGDGGVIIPAGESFDVRLTFTPTPINGATARNNNFSVGALSGTTTSALFVDSAYTVGAYPGTDAAVNNAISTAINSGQAVAISLTGTRITTTTARPHALIGQYYQINTADDLIWFANETAKDEVKATYAGIEYTLSGPSINAYFMPVAAIDLTGSEFAGIGTAEKPYVGITSGSKTITIPTRTVTDGETAGGIFNYVAAGGEIYGITVNGTINTSGNAVVGGIVGSMTDGATIQWCTSNVTINGTNSTGSIGGVIGVADKVNSPKTVGAGAYNLINNGNITATIGSDTLNVGGIVGTALNSSFAQKITNTGAISGGTNIGGIIGCGTDTVLSGASGNIIENTGAISGDGNSVAGIIGLATDCTLNTFIQNTGVISGSAVNKGDTTGQTSTTPSKFLTIGSLGAGGTVAATYGDARTPIISGTTAVPEGKTVYLTVTPSANYQLKAGTLKWNDTVLSIAPYTFTMPGQAVVISAEFEAIPPAAVSEVTFKIGDVTGVPRGGIAEIPVMVTVPEGKVLYGFEVVLQYLQNQFVAGTIEVTAPIGALVTSPTTCGATAGDHVIIKSAVAGTPLALDGNRQFTFNLKGTVLPSLVPGTSNSIVFYTSRLTSAANQSHLLDAEFTNVAGYIPAANLQPGSIKVADGDPLADAAGVYQLANLSDLTWFANKVNGTEEGGNLLKAKVIANIGSAAAPFTTSIGTAERPFKGTFDGNYLTVTISLVAAGDNVGLFGYTDGATLQGIVVAGIITGSGNNIGGIVGYAKDTTITAGTMTNRANINVSGDNVGGVVGYAQNTTIATGSNSAEIIVTGNHSNVGGIVGYAKDVVISGVPSNSGIVNAVDSTDVGGLIGNFVGTSTIGGINTAAITGKTNVGGFFGTASGLAINGAANRYNSGSVLGAGNVGGIVGNAVDTTINTVYNQGNVTATVGNAGGIVGTASGSGTINDTFHKSGFTVSAVGAAAGGIVGSTVETVILTSNYGVGNVTGLTVGGIVGTGTAAGTGNYYNNTIAVTGSTFGTAAAPEELVFGANNKYSYVHAWRGQGTGTASDPYIITDAEQLDWARNKLSAYFELGNDIDLTDYLAEGGDGYNGGAGWLPVGDATTPFAGSFNGAGYSITGLWINRPAETAVGFFGVLGANNSQNGLVKNLGIVLDAKGIIGGTNSGGLAGSISATNWSGPIPSAPESLFYRVDGCHVTGTGTVADTKNIAGGLVAVLGNYTGIKNSYATVSVTSAGYGRAGGLVGTGSTYAAIIDSYATGAVSGVSYVGGLVGLTAPRWILRCYALGNVVATGNIVGGLAGEISSACIVTDSYAQGNVTGSASVGSLIGSAVQGGNITNTYTVGTVTSSTGAASIGFIGTATGTPVITSSYYIGLTTSYGEAKTAAELEDAATFVGWDTNAWVLGNGYPYLTGQPAAAKYEGVVVDRDSLSQIKAVYQAGETFDASGFVAYALYSDGSREVLEDSYYTVSKTEPLTIADSLIQITVNYRGKSNYADVRILIIDPVAPFSGIGDGTPEDPYQLTFAEDILWFNKAALLDRTINAVLGNDIDMSGVSGFAGISTVGYTEIIEASYYGGVFDGAGHTITLNMSERNAALFGFVDGATIKNLTVAGTVTAINSAAGLVYTVSNSVIDNCHNKADITSGSNAAGISVQVNSTSITNSSNSGTIQTGGDAGGIASNIRRGSTVDHSQNSGAVTGGGIIGGVVGTAGSLTGTDRITNSSNSGTITSTANTSSQFFFGSYGGAAGGILGAALDGALVIDNCANSGDVTGTANSLGGVLGAASPSLGGNGNPNITIIGSSNSGNISSTYDGNDPLTTSKVNVGGIAGYLEVGAPNSGPNAGISPVNVSGNSNTGNVTAITGENISSIVGNARVYDPNERINGNSTTVLVGRDSSNSSIRYIDPNYVSPIVPGNPTNPINPGNPQTPSYQAPSNQTATDTETDAPASGPRTNAPSTNSTAPRTSTQAPGSTATPNTEVAPDAQTPLMGSELVSTRPVQAFVEYVMDNPLLIPVGILALALIVGGAAFAYVRFKRNTEDPTERKVG